MDSKILLWKYTRHGGEKINKCLSESLHFSVQHSSRKRLFLMGFLFFTSLHLLWMESRKDEFETVDHVYPFLSRSLVLRSSQSNRIFISYAQVLKETSLMSPNKYLCLLFITVH